jgi:mucin-2
MAANKRADKQKEKEKKEKIILAVLVAVMIVVGAIELPSLMKKSSSGPSSSAGAPTQTTSTSAAAGSSGTPVPGANSGGVESLPNSSTYTADSGQLSGFSLFNSRDPFGSSTTPSAESATAPSSTTTAPTKTSKTTTTSQSQFAAARIIVNGASEDVALNTTFPSTSAVFALESVTSKKIEIGVAGGSFSNGQAKVAIGKGRSITLVNTVDSMRYVIKFVTALTASAGGTTGTTLPGTTLPGTTLPGTTSPGTTSPGTTSAGTAS